MLSVTFFQLVEDFMITSNENIIFNSRILHKTNKNILNKDMFLKSTFNLRRSPYFLLLDSFYLNYWCRSVSSQAWNYQK